MIRQVAVAASIALLGFSGQAMAAQTAKLASVSGSVLVNQNGRFAPAKSATTLRAGDRVLTMNGGASLIYANGCKVEVAPRSMATISDAACGGEAQVVRVQNDVTTTEGTVTQEEAIAAANSVRGDGGYGATRYNNADFWLWVGFGVLTAAALAAAFADDEEPVSP